MNRLARLLRIVGFVGALIAGASPARAEHAGTPPTYPRSIEQSLAALLVQSRSRHDDPELLLALSEEYLDAGDDLYSEERPRRSAYQEGAQLAQRVIALQDTNAHAHFLYAAHLGNDKRLAGYAPAMRSLKEIRFHLVRAIALAPDHPRALQFMGGLLAELPWFLGGDDTAAREYLERAVAVDGNYTNARLLLAKLYLKANRDSDASAQLAAVVHADNPHYERAWRHRIRPEADQLLKQVRAGRTR